MANTIQPRRPISRMWAIVKRAALIPAISIVASLFATPCAQAQTYEALYNFSGQGTDGGYPSSSLIADKAGNLYGTAHLGGAYNRGVVFKLDKTGKETVLYSFTGIGGDGAIPQGALVRDAAGNFYGTTYSGGDLTCGNGSGCGTVFKLDTTGKETVLYRFRGYPTDGSNPPAGVIRDAAGNFYGTTYSGGTAATGTVFKVDTTGHETVLHNFTLGPDGGWPYAGLVRDKTGNLYGTASDGGNSACGGCGVIFKVDSTGHETVLYTFTGVTDGFTPYGGLIRDGVGNLYGTTAFGGSTTGCNGNGCGTVFKLDTTGHETILHRFTGTDGEKPYGSVVRDGRGNLYGSTLLGGAYSYGTIFKLDTAGKETVLHSFSYSASGASPLSASLWGAAGKLYGTTSEGGPSGGGLVFQIVP
jgi:uncharacterized repeat protein (TIGR03803 family)